MSSPSKKLFLCMYATCSFFLFFWVLFGLSPFYTTWRGWNTCLVPLHDTTHDTAGQWMRGGPGEEGSWRGPDMSSGDQQGPNKMESQKAKQKTPKSRREEEGTCRAIAIGHARYRDRFFLPPSPPLPLATSW